MPFSTNTTLTQLLHFNASNFQSENFFEDEWEGYRVGRVKNNREANKQSPSHWHRSHQLSPSVQSVGRLHVREQHHFSEIHILISCNSQIIPICKANMVCAIKCVIYTEMRVINIIDWIDNNININPDNVVRLRCHNWNIISSIYWQQICIHKYANKDMAV
jgi:hypothetical protein